MLNLIKAGIVGGPDRGIRRAAPTAAVGVLYATLVLGFWPPGLDQFLLPKALVLLVGAPAVAAVAMAARAGGRVSPSAERVDLALAGLAVAWTLWSVVVPLWSARNRQLHVIGAAEVILLGILFAVAVGIRTGGDPRATRRLLRLLAFPAAVVTLFALLQGLGADPLRILFHLSSSRPGRWHVLTTLGNPTWNAELLAASLPVVLAAFVAEGRRTGGWSALQAAAALLVTAAVAVTGSRAGLLSLAAGGAAFWTLAAPASPARRRASRAAVPAALIVAGGILIAVAAGASRWREVRPLTGRLGLWAAGGVLACRAPVTGWGVRHTGLVLSEGLETVVARVPPRLRGWLPTTLVDRLDDDWLQVMVERGIPASLLLLALWLRAIRLPARRARSRGSIEDAAIAGSLVALAVCSLVSAPLHTPATSALFWILAGLAAATATPVSTPPRTVRNRRWPWAAGSAAAALATAVAVVLSVRLLAADTRAGEGHRLLRAGRPAAAVKPLRTAVNEAPWLTAAAADLTVALEKSGDLQRALAVAVEAQQWTASERLWAVQTRTLSGLGHDAAARLVLSRALRALPCSPILRRADAVLHPPSSTPPP